MKISSRPNLQKRRWCLLSCGSENIKKWFWKKLFKTSSCHCGEGGNMSFSRNLTDITAQYRGQIICSENAHLHFNALVENNSAYVPKCIFKSFKFKFYLLPVPSKPCNVHYFSPVLFKVLKFDLRSFQENWNFVRNKKSMDLQACLLSN